MAVKETETEIWGERTGYGEWLVEEQDFGHDVYDVASVLFPLLSAEIYDVVFDDG